MHSSLEKGLTHLQNLSVVTDFVVEQQDIVQILFYLHVAFEDIKDGSCIHWCETREIMI